MPFRVIWPSSSNRSAIRRRKREAAPPLKRKRPKRRPLKKPRRPRQLRRRKRQARKLRPPRLRAKKPRRKPERKKKRNRKKFFNSRITQGKTGRSDESGRFLRLGWFKP